MSARKIITLEELAKTEPERAKYLYEYAKEMEKKDNQLYKLYKEKVCLECGSPRQIPNSRYCNRHQAVVEKCIEHDRRLGKTLQPNYGYSEPGFNFGLNAYIHDREHFNRLTKYLEGSESLISVG